MIRILIVDDEPAVRGFLDTLLTIKGFNTLAAPTPAHADALLLDFPHSPDIAVLDLLLRGGLDGVGYADTLRVRYPPMRVVFITGWQEPGALLTAAQARGQVLFKPFTSQQLLAAIAPPET